MRVFVKNMRGKALMPCSCRKARLLLKENKAKIVDCNPFTIQLIIPTGETIQEVSLGVDSGATYVGIAVTSEDKVLAKGTIELRTDVSTLLTARNTIRRFRRYRKTRYRKPKFKYHTKRVYNPKKRKFVKQKLSFESSRPEGWLPPSIQGRIDNQLFWINKFASLLPNPKIRVEVGKFDVQKILNPDISEVGYQQGDAFGFWNTRYYVFARDKYTCRICKKKGGILHTHHIIQQKYGGSDRADNLATVHEQCHIDFHAGKIKTTFKKPTLYRETAFMNILRKQIFKRLQCDITYGSYTTIQRKLLKLEKSHFNDAIAISGISSIKENSDSCFYIKQFRKKKRSLHEQTPRKGRKEPNRLQKRNSKNTPYSNGLFLNDKVRLFNKVGFVSGFCDGGMYVQDISGEYITIPDKKYKQVPFRVVEKISHNNNWQFIPHL